MIRFIKKLPNKAVDEERLLDVFRRLESDDAGQIAQGIELAQTDPALRSLVERRYLNFVRARLRDPNARLSDLARVRVEPELLDFILKSLDIHTDPDVTQWNFEYERGEQALSLLVDLCGGLMASYVDLERYVEHHLKYMRSRDLAELDYDNDLLGRGPSSLAPVMAPLHPSGWFGRLVQYVTGCALISIDFNHVDCSVVDDSPALDAFLAWVCAFMDHDKLRWDFAQSQPIRFSSAVYVYQYNWEFICQSLVTPDDFDPKYFTHAESPLWRSDPRE